MKCCSRLRQKECSSESDRPVKLNKSTVGIVGKNVQCKTLDQILNEKIEKELKKQLIQQLKQCRKANNNFPTIVIKNEQESSCDWDRASTSI